MSTPSGNSILAALPASEYSYFRPHLKIVEWDLGHTVCEPNAPQAFLYFPTTAVAGTLNSTTEARPAAEIAIVGSEGAVGMQLSLGESPAIGRTVVLSSGEAYRVPAAKLTGK